MSAQFKTLDQLIADGTARREAAIAAELQRDQAALAARRDALLAYIDDKLSDVLRLLGLTKDDFEVKQPKHNGYFYATTKWEQPIGSSTYPLVMTVTEGQCSIECAAGSRSVSHVFLSPGPQDPVEYLGLFLAELPDRWQLHLETLSHKALERMGARIDGADDIAKLLAVAAAMDEEEAMHESTRKRLRKEIASKIRYFRRCERADRAQRNADLIYAAAIIELAQAYVQEYAWYELACYDWAIEWTRELWAPGELYKVRYMPVTAGTYTESFTRDVVIMENPSTLELGNQNTLVTEVTPQGQACQRWIGAFLDASPIRWHNPCITDRYMYHTSLRAGDYYVNIPPADLVPVDTDAVDAARPTPPDRWQDWLVARYEGDRTLALPAAAQTNWSSAMDAFDLARMTPADFLAYPKINL